MRKLSVLILFATIISCNSNSNDKATDTKTTDTSTPAESKVDSKAQQGLELVAKSDCFTCHKIAEVSTGPTYMDVAARYPNNQAVIDSLAEKIIKGGVGNWGTVPMIGHPTLSPEDAKTMVEYVLSLKK